MKLTLDKLVSEKFLQNKNSKNKVSNRKKTSTTPFQFHFPFNTPPLIENIFNFNLNLPRDIITIFSFPLVFLPVKSNTKRESNHFNLFSQTKNKRQKRTDIDRSSSTLWHSIAVIEKKVRTERNCLLNVSLGEHFSVTECERIIEPFATPSIVFHLFYNAKMTKMKISSLSLKQGDSNRFQSCNLTLLKNKKIVKNVPKKICL